MGMPTKSELQSKFNVLQQDYKTKLDDIFDKLYKRIEELEPTGATPSAPEAPTAPSKASVAPEAPATPSQASKAPEAPYQASPEAPSPSYDTTPNSGASFAPEMPNKWKKPPRWRDTWTYQGLKGLASRVWRGTNPDQDIAWKYASENEGLLSRRITLQEYLDLRESSNSFVDYYFVIEEAMQPEISDAFNQAKIEITKTVFDFLKQAHDLGIKLGDLTATTRYMFPPKQQFLFDKGQPEPKNDVVPTDKSEPQATSPSETKPQVMQPELKPETKPQEMPPEKKPKNEKKADLLPVIENPAQVQGEILENMIEKFRQKDLEPFKPWTWFAWAKKPSGIYKKANPDAKEALLKQWQEQAGKKFTTELEGLTNMFLAFGKGWFGDIDYTNNKIVAGKIENLIGKQVKGRPWTDFVNNFEDENSAEIYLSEQGVGKPSRGSSVATSAPETSAPETSAPETNPLEPANSSIEDWDDDSGRYSD